MSNVLQSEPYNSLADEKKNLMVTTIVSTKRTTRVGPIEWQFYFHGKMSRGQAETRLVLPGDFLVRLHDDSSELLPVYIISVFWKDKLHFKLLYTESNRFVLEGYSFEEVHELIWFYWTKQEILTEKSQAILRRSICRKTPPKNENTFINYLPLTFCDKVNKAPLENQIFYHNNIERADAEAILKSDGHFLVRTSTHSNASIVISVFWKGSARHLSLKLDKLTGAVLIDNQRYSSVPDLIYQYWKNQNPVSMSSCAILSTAAICSNSINGPERSLSQVLSTAKQLKSQLQDIPTKTTTTNHKSDRKKLHTYPKSCKINRKQPGNTNPANTIKRTVAKPSPSEALRKNKKPIRAAKIENKTVNLKQATDARAAKLDAEKQLRQEQLRRIQKLQSQNKKLLQKIKQKQNVPTKAELRSNTLSQEDSSDGDE